MYHWNEMYLETYVFDQTNTQTVLSLKTYVSNKYLYKMG